MRRHLDVIGDAISTPFSHYLVATTPEQPLKNWHYTPTAAFGQSLTAIFSATILTTPTAQIR